MLFLNAVLGSIKHNILKNKSEMKLDKQAVESFQVGVTKCKNCSVTGLINQKKVLSKREIWS